MIEITAAFFSPGPDPELATLMLVVCSPLGVVLIAILACIKCLTRAVVWNTVVLTCITVDWAGICILVDWARS